MTDLLLMILIGSLSMGVGVILGFFLCQRLAAAFGRFEEESWRTLHGAIDRSMQSIDGMHEVSVRGTREIIEAHARERELLLGHIASLKKLGFTEAADDGDGEPWAIDRETELEEWQRRQGEDD
jgi:hypothetical protein